MGLWHPAPGDYSASSLVRTGWRAAVMREEGEVRLAKLLHDDEP